MIENKPTNKESTIDAVKEETISFDIPEENLFIEEDEIDDLDSDENDDDD